MTMVMPLLFLFRAILLSAAHASAPVAVAVAPEVCAIAGTVVDESRGRPVERVKVSAGSPEDDESDEAKAAVRRLTNTDGHFCFERLSAGSYRLTLEKARYLEKRGTILRVSSQRPAPTPLIFKITPQAVMSGVITDAEGDPIPFGEIRLWKLPMVKSSPLALRTAVADELGRFEVRRVAAGSYAVSALPQRQNVRGITRNGANSVDGTGQPFREREVETFYRTALSAGGATPIDIKAGQEITGLTIPIQRAAARRISGRVLGQGNTGEAELWLMSRNGFQENITVGKDGSFQLQALPPGKYRILAASPRDGARVFKEVDVSGGDVDGLELRLIETFGVKAYIHLEGSKSSLPRSEIALAEDEREQPAVSEEGRFEGLVAEVYHVVLGRNPEHYFLKRVAIEVRLKGTT